MHNLNIKIKYTAYYPNSIILHVHEMPNEACREMMVDSRGSLVISPPFWAIFSKARRVECVVRGSKTHCRETEYVDYWEIRHTILVQVNRAELKEHACKNTQFSRLEINIKQY